MTFLTANELLHVKKYNFVFISALIKDQPWAHASPPPTGQKAWKKTTCFLPWMFFGDPSLLTCRSLMCSVTKGLRALMLLLLLNEFNRNKGPCCEDVPLILTLRKWWQPVMATGGFLTPERRRESKFFLFPFYSPKPGSFDHFSHSP